jgi:hypothetical protein
LTINLAQTSGFEFYFCRLNSGWELPSVLCPCRGNFMIQASSFLFNFWFFIFYLIFFIKLELNWTYCKFSGPDSLVSEQLCSWRDYYTWRCIPLHSPVALPLQWVWLCTFSSSHIYCHPVLSNSGNSVLWHSRFWWIQFENAIRSFTYRIFACNAIWYLLLHIANFLPATVKTIYPQSILLLTSQFSS